MRWLLEHGFDIRLFIGDLKTDIVIATLFHNVLYELLCSKPVISISFHPKCESLMSDMGLSTYHLDINKLTNDILIDKFRDLNKDSETIKELIRAKVREFGGVFGRNVDRATVEQYRRDVDVPAAITAMKHEPAGIGGLRGQ